MGQRLNYFGKLKYGYISAAKASFKRAMKVIVIKPETT